MQLVVFDIAAELLFPVFDVRFWGGCISATLMMMPETAVDEDDGHMLWKHDVRSARKASDVLAETIAKAKEIASDLDFDRSILASDMRHDH